MDKIIIKGARENNLKNIDLEIPKNKLVVFTGLSGSGKSSLAFDTIYAEGQRRYVESLSSYARQFLGIMKKPDIDLIEGLSPAISIDQKSASHNPRSTVGTVTEIYDYLRLLYARIGHPHCPNCGREISRMTKEQITNAVFELLDKNISKNLKLLILAPIVKDRKGEYTELFVDLKKRGYKKARIDNQIFALDEDFVLIKTNKHTIEAVIDQIVLDKTTDRNRVSADVEQGLKLGSGELIISIIKDKGFSMPEKPKLMEDEFFSEKFACPVCNIFLPEIEPRIFSFNTPHGACTTCSGLGNILTVDQDLIFNDNLTVSEGGLMPYQNLLTHETWASRTFKVFCEENNIPISKRLSEYTKEQKELLLNGTGEKLYYVIGSNRWGKETAIEEPFKGILEDLKEKYQSAESSFLKSQIEKYMRFETCPSCKGARLKKEALSVTINGKSIVEVSDMPINSTYDFMNDLDSITNREKEISKLILKEIKQRLTFLVDVGLDYLTLSRGAQTLAGGEAQRIRLASQIGSGLTGVLYVLDEPSIGLHQRDNQKLIDTLKKLRDLGNTVLVVEHDEETMLQADYIVDFGPGAGEQGGHIVAQGTYDQIINNPKSLTGEYLSLKRKIKIDRDGKENDSTKVLRIEGATEHNLKNIDVDFPLNKLVVVTGVSGSGKSTLVNDILYHALMQKNNPYHRQKPGKYTNINGFQNIKNIFMIDQSPIGRTPRSNPATYIGAFNYIRDLFAKTKDAKIKGYGPGRFSFNVKGGRCEACEGEGRIKIEMQFLPDVYVTCEVCDGQQYNQEALEVEYNGKNISQVLRMSAAEALTFFIFVPGLSHKLQTLNDVGLGYLKLGQPAPTLSGGEAQRVKLAAELSKRGSNALYLLDEPTTGLHFADLEKLLHVLRKLVDLGNTVIVIEHNLDVIKNADHIIDLGPEGGEKGGQLVVVGTPEEVAKNKESYTGKFLKTRLEM
jgi:excinuclease ABC subunit A